MNPTTAAGSTGAMLSPKKLGTELGSQSRETGGTLPFSDAFSRSPKTNLKINEKGSFELSRSRIAKNSKTPISKMGWGGGGSGGLATDTHTQQT